MKNSDKIIVIERSVARGIFNILNTCYKAGVKDAEYVNDHDLCETFANEVRVPNVYGRVKDENLMNAVQWRCAIPLINAGCPLPKASIEFLVCIDKYHKLYQCSLPIAQEFYIKGMEDFNKNPTIHNFVLLDNRRMERWTRNGIKQVTIHDMLITLQELCLKRSINDEQYDGNKFALRRRLYEKFAMSIWGALQ